MAIGNLVDPPATMINSAGDYVVCYIVARVTDGKAETLEDGTLFYPWAE